MIDMHMCGWRVMMLALPDHSPGYGVCNVTSTTEYGPCEVVICSQSEGNI